MPVPKYGVLVGRAADRRFATPNSNHYELKVLAGNNAPYRIAVNTQSQDGSEVLYAVKPRFQHPSLAKLEPLDEGYHALDPTPASGAIDFVKGPGYVKRGDLTPLPSSIPGNDNDLNDKIDALVQRAFDENNARVYAFGSLFRNPGQKDKYFGFKPTQGIHDVHMNQGNAPNWRDDDGPWQDGALLFRFEDGTWTAVFLAFQNQSWQTDAQGHATGIVPPAPEPVPVPQPIPVPVPLGPPLRIIAAVANSVGTPDIETVTLINPSPAAVDLAGWLLRDKNRNQFVLSGSISAGETRKVQVAKPLELGNKGGSITLVDSQGAIVDGVSYSQEQSSQPGWTIVF